MAPAIQIAEEINTIEQYENIFEQKPKGMWLPEQCICSKTAELLSKHGFS